MSAPRFAIKNIFNFVYFRFRWAACQLDELAKCLNRRTLKEALTHLPKSLDETYDRILCSIPENYRQNALDIFTWLTFSKQPLLLEEVAEVTGFVNEKNSFDPDGILPDPKDILTICSSLIVFVDSKGKHKDTSGRAVYWGHGNESYTYVALAHLSVKDYFQSDRIAHEDANFYSLKLVPSSLKIARSCLIFLLHIDQTKASGPVMTANFKLTKYCAWYWARHLEDVPEKERVTLHGLTKQFLVDQETAFEICKTLPFKTSDTSPLKHVAGFSLADIVKLLLTAGTKHLNSALFASSQYGQVDIVKLLIERGATDLDNALKRAAYWGKSDIVELLIKKGAKSLDAALKAASGEGQFDIVKLLIMEGATDLDSALQDAAYWGKVNIVELLIKKGAKSLNAALRCASGQGRIDIVKLLIKEGATGLNSALQGAAFSGQSDTVELLIKEGARKLSTACYEAARMGRVDIIKLLVKNGANLDTALQEAALSGEVDTIELLVKEGANLNTALKSATIWDDPRAVELLFNEKARVREGHPTQDG